MIVVQVVLGLVFIEMLTVENMDGSRVNVEQEYFVHVQRELE